jgi:hypothetical protein
MSSPFSKECQPLTPSLGIARSVFLSRDSGIPMISLVQEEDSIDVEGVTGVD